MTSCDTSANRPIRTGFSQVSFRTTPRTTSRFCEAVMRDFPDGEHPRRSRDRGRAPPLPGLRRAGGQRVSHPGRQDGRQVSHRTVHPRPVAARGTHRRRPGRAEPGQALGCWTAGRGGRTRSHRGPDPRRLRPLQLGHPGTAEPARRAHPRPLHPGVLREDQHIKVRPELDKALILAHEIKTAAPYQPVILAVHELKRLARNAAELMTLSAQLQAAGIQLELLSGPLTGIYDPHGMGSMLFAVLAVAAQLDRDYIREKTLEGQLAAAARGNHGGRPKVIDPDMAIFARALRDQGTPIPDIAQKLKIQSGKNAGKHPSVASLYRALAETDAQHLATRP